MLKSSDVDYNKRPGVSLLKNEKYLNLDIEKPEVSVIMPSYNSEDYIIETINSVLNQTFPFFEILIVDDGSKEEHAKKLDKIEKMDKRIKVFHKENEGVSKARDYAASKASKHSKYFLILDDDDLYEKEFLEKAYISLELNKDAAWAYTGLINFGEEKYIWKPLFDKVQMIEENILQNSALIRKEVFFEVGGYGLAEKEVNEDWVFWLKIISKGYYPVQLGDYDFWYRRKLNEKSLLNRTKTKENLEKTKKLLEEYQTNIKEKKATLSNWRYKTDDERRKFGVIYPHYDFYWDIIPEELPENIRKKEIEDNGKIKILIIIPWLVVGGADRFIIDMIKGLDKEKYEVIILTTVPGGNEWKQEIKYDVKAFYSMPDFLPMKYWPAFADYIIKTNNIDTTLVSVTNAGYTMIPFLKIKNPDMPINIYIHMEVWYDKNGGCSRHISNLEKYIDKVYFCNGRSEKILHEHFNFPKEKIETVYIGVDEEKYDPNKVSLDEAKEYFNKFEIPYDKKIVGFIARIAEQKRPVLLAKIVNRVKELDDNIHFLIGGEGYMKPELESNTKNANITFLGNVKEPKYLYKVSDLTLNCSIKEGLALTSYESLSMDIPVVSSDVGGQAELISDEVGKIIPLFQDELDVLNFNYSDEEVDMYANAIIEIANNLDKYKGKCRERILSGFTLNHMKEKMSKVFKESKENPNKENIEFAKSCGDLNLAKELYVYNRGETMEYSMIIDEYNHRYSKYRSLKDKIGERLWKYRPYRGFVKIVKKLLNR